MSIIRFFVSSKNLYVAVYFFTTKVNLRKKPNWAIFPTFSFAYSPSPSPSPPSSPSSPSSPLLRIKFYPNHLTHTIFCGARTLLLFINFYSNHLTHTIFITLLALHNSCGQRNSRTPQTPKNRRYSRISWLLFQTVVLALHHSCFKRHSRTP